MGTPVVLGLDFGGTKVAAAVAEMSGERIGESTVETDPSRGARWNLDNGLDAACLLIDDVAAGRDVIAVGACTFGIPAAQGVGLAPAIPGWEELALGHELEVTFDCSTVRLATDVKAAAAAELASGALAGHDPALYLNLGTGLAVAIACGGKIVSGANGAAGEIGYNLRELSDLDLDRAEHVVLEEVVSGMALAVSGRRRTGREMTAGDVFAGAAADRRLADVLDHFVRELSFHLVNLTIALDPSCIAVGGGMVRSWDRLAPPLRRALDDSVPFPPALVVGAFPFDAALVGALNLALAAAAERAGAPAGRPLGTPTEAAGGPLGATSEPAGAPADRPPAATAEQAGLPADRPTDATSDGPLEAPSGRSRQSSRAAR